MIEGQKQQASQELTQSQEEAQQPKRVADNTGDGTPAPNVDVTFNLESAIQGVEPTSTDYTDVYVLQDGRVVEVIKPMFNVDATVRTNFEGLATASGLEPNRDQDRTYVIHPAGTTDYFGNQITQTSDADN